MSVKEILKRISEINSESGFNMISWEVTQSPKTGVIKIEVGKYRGGTINLKDSDENWEVDLFNFLKDNLEHLAEREEGKEFEIMHGNRKNND